MADSALNSDRSDVARQARRLSIIDFSSEDDSLLGLAPAYLQDDASSGNQGLRDMELFVSVDGTKLEELFEPVDDKRSDGFGQIDVTIDSVPEPQPSESAEPEMIRKNGKCNLRKSLAWDSAFFTCEGFLDAEELSDMISVENGQKKMLPRIQEEVHRSTDSISTLASDTLTLESVETNLFDDVRASIQLSSKVAVKASESSKLKPGLRVAKVGGGLKEADVGIQRKLNPKVVSRKPIVSIQNPDKAAKPVSTCPRPQISQRIKVLDKPMPSTTRMPIRGSLSGVLPKVEKDNPKIPVGRAKPVSKLPGSVRNVPPRPSKSSSLASSTEKSDSSGTTSSSLKLGKSLPNPVRRKTDPVNGSSSSSGSILKTPSRIPGNKIPTGKPSFPGQIVPSKNLSSNVSPASSISDWSSESVSSSSSFQQISRGSRGSFSRTSMDFDTCQSVDGQSQTDGSVGSASRASGSKASRAVSESAVSSKPSGLRLPSPKIGFFDGAKSAVRTPKRGNISVPSNLPKSGTLSVSPRRSSIKSKLGKSNSAKPDAQGTSSNSKPKASPISESPKAAKAEICNKSGNVENTLTASLVGKTATPLKFDLKVEDASFSPKTDDTVLVIEDCVGEIGSVLNPQNPTLAREMVENEKNGKFVSETEKNLIKSSDELGPIPNFEDAELGKSVSETELNPIKNSDDLGLIPDFGNQEVVEDSEHGKSVSETELNPIQNGDELGPVIETLKIADDANCGRSVPKTEPSPIRNSDNLVSIPNCENPTSPREMNEEARQVKSVFGIELKPIKNSDKKEKSSSRETVNALTFQQSFIGEEDNVCSSKPVVSSTSPIINENAACKRKPFSARDSLCNIGESNGEFPCSEERFDKGTSL